MELKDVKPLWEDYGESSLTLLSVYCRIEKRSPTVPYDASDFKRCVHLCECLQLTRTEIKALIYSTSIRFAKWKPFFIHWDKLMSLHNDGGWHRLSAFIRTLNETCKIISDKNLQEKAENHVNKHDGGGWNLLDRYTDGTAKISWFKGDRTYIKIIK